MCLVCSGVDQISLIGRMDGKKKFLVPESVCTNSAKNAIATGQVQTINIH